VLYLTFKHNYDEYNSKIDDSSTKPELLMINSLITYFLSEIYM